MDETVCKCAGGDLRKADPTEVIVTRYRDTLEIQACWTCPGCSAHNQRDIEDREATSLLMFGADYDLEERVPGTSKIHQPNPEPVITHITFGTDDAQLFAVPLTTAKVVFDPEIKTYIGRFTIKGQVFEVDLSPLVVDVLITHGISFVEKNSAQELRDADDIIDSIRIIQGSDADRALQEFLSGLATSSLRTNEWQNPQPGFEPPERGDLGIG